ncbi:hypothetical protein HK101_006168, partial [Irineochytrium annulatum]
MSQVRSSENLMDALREENDRLRDAMTGVKSLIAEEREAGRARATTDRSLHDMHGGKRCLREELADSAYGSMSELSADDMTHAESRGMVAKRTIPRPVRLGAASTGAISVVAPAAEKHEFGSQTDEGSIGGRTEWIEEACQTAEPDLTVTEVLSVDIAGLEMESSGCQTDPFQRPMPELKEVSIDVDVTLPSTRMEAATQAGAKT